MFQTILLKKENIPSKTAIETVVHSLGYNFKIIGDYDHYETIIGGGNILECSINDFPSDVEMYVQKIEDVLPEIDFLKSDLSNEDTAISFVWVADNFTGICIGLISIALIEICNAIVAFDYESHEGRKVKLSKQMIIKQTEDLLKRLPDHAIILDVGFTSEKNQKKRSIWNWFKNIFK